MKEFDSIIPAGGKGIRLRPITQDKAPKSLCKIGGKELILHTIESLPPEYFDRIILVVKHHADQIEKWAQINLSVPYTICKQKEEGLLNAITSGVAVSKKDKLLACHSDEVREGLNLEDLINFHKKSGKLATVVAAFTNNLARYRVLRIRPQDQLLTGSIKYPEEYLQKPNVFGWVNAGILVMDKRAIEYADPNYSAEWDGLLEPLCHAGKLIAYKATGMTYFNINTPQEYNDAQAYFQKKVNI